MTRAESVVYNATPIPLPIVVNTPCSKVTSKVVISDNEPNIIIKPMTVPINPSLSIRSAENQPNS